MSNDLRIVRDIKAGEQAPSHILETGETEALCGEDCTGYTYSIYNPSLVLEGPGKSDICPLCVLCHQEYLEQNER